MNNIEFVLASLAIAGGGITIVRTIFQIAEMKSDLEKTMALRNEELSNEVRISTRRIELQIKEFEGKQEKEDYRFEVLEGQINDLRNHQSDLQKYLAANHGYNIRPYTNLENTYGKKIERKKQD
ncbi:MAG: hypothetical protein SAJ12_07295 [Jaaginema sp. PMC 1079.18]|nr:hypothetical protein [Jaaginema sp. PMC 1080.18]MEC4850802.1 hypothetical protein [Jaaginema sp. PMC 1079.18]MEC4868173.1 hypothetical protein [Jaaginema sp. PMC 1078.18]